MRFKLKILLYWLQFRFLHRFRTRDELLAFQKRRLSSFFRSTLSRSSFYSWYIKPSPSLSNIPIIEKTRFMKHFNSINTVGIDREAALELALRAEKSRDFSPELNGITVGLSTGTSGHRGIFLASEDERAKWVAMVMTRVIKPKWKKQRIAFFLRASSNLYSSVNSVLFAFEYFDIFKPVAMLAGRLAEYQPHILAAPPSVLADLARLQERGELNIRPQQVISFAEVLYESDRRYIEKIFGPITEIYQCTEGFLGASCSEGVMHLNEDIVLIEKEYIDENRFFPLITDFTRSSQPVVRYRLTDILVEKTEPCKCGSVFTAVSCIEGRADHLLIFRTSDDFVTVYPDLLCRRIAFHTADFRAYKIVQPDWDQLDVYIESDQFPQTRSAFEAAIMEVLNGFGVSDVTIRWHSRLEPLNGSKQVKIERKFPFI